jgi:hypothetical protein
MLAGWPAPAGGPPGLPPWAEASTATAKTKTTAASQKVNALMVIALDFMRLLFSASVSFATLEKRQTGFTRLSLQKSHFSYNAPLETSAIMSLFFLEENHYKTAPAAKNLQIKSSLQ